jgi:hypothetical protein
VQSAPVQVPPTQARPPQLGPLFCHVPDAPQFCGWAPLHWIWVGAQVPLHCDGTPLPTQVWFTHAVGVAQVPVELHACCVVVVAHSTSPGAHRPWHDAVPPVTRQVLWLQVAGEPQAPLVLQVETPLLVHWVAPGVQLPVQTPPTHAWLVQLTAGPHIPLVSQVWTAAFPEQALAPGEQVPVQAPFEQTAAQATGAPHWPLLLHVWTPLPTPPSAVVEQRVAPGVHEPVHEPPTHAWLVQVEGVPQLPVALHVATPLTEPPSAAVAHSVAPGEQTPVQEALPLDPVQAWLVQAVAVPHVPDAVQAWMAVVPEQRVWPGPHTPPHAPPRQVVLDEHAVGVPQVPLAVQIETPLVEPPSEPVAHVVEPGEQTPWHCAPSEPPVTQAWFGQVTAGPQLPPVQVWMAELPEHW